MGKTKNTDKRKVKKKRTRRKKNPEIKEIVDVPLSNKKSVGTRATKGEIDFHYCKWSNVNHFFRKIHLKNLTENSVYIELICNDNKISPIYPKKPEVGKKQFTLIRINVSTDKGNHANIALVNNHNKTIEYFEPHGYRKNKNSKIDDFKGIYLKKLNALKKIFKEILPKYTFINVVAYERMTSFQTKLDPDENMGFCVTWCILFAHYRCLNPKILISKLIKHMANKITTTKLLKYAKFVEETVKKKI